jgi:hypothetical protein
MVFLPPFLAGKTPWGLKDRQNSALPKKGSSTAELEELAAGTSKNCVPAAIPHPPCRESWQWVLAQLHRPQASAQTRNCLVLLPKPHAGIVGVGPLSPGCATQGA